MNSPPHPEKHINVEYNQALDHRSSRAAMADQGILFVNPKDVRFWNERGGGGDEEINGRYVATPAPLSALSVVEIPEEDPGLPGTIVCPSPPATLPHHYTNPHPHPQHLL
jgi:myotubularin-related protein 6/7/8